ncbi:MAG TPA: DNA modification methylase [Planctomycetales bacterium]|jgi:adenine-specific DNA-methyltransferase|nr:DNA modification methylase [Planctomycetales bacterium]
MAPSDQSAEHPDYLSKQLITYIGNKRSLLGHIDKAVFRVKERLGKSRLRIFDAFAGSGVVSRYFKRHAERLVSNDLENFAAVAGRCFLRNHSSVDLSRLRKVVDDLNGRAEMTEFPPGFIEKLYAPADESDIAATDRVFYTRDNASRLDNYRRLLEGVDPAYRDLLLGPLLSEASVHANTSGVFKGFYKDRATGIGKFGGSNGDALVRIKGRIELDVPVLSRFECDVEVHQQDANTLAGQLRGFDLAYFDPPYNQHPYGSNYFMLNLLVDYQKPELISTVSGIPTDWQRSDYNVRSRCLSRLAELIRAVDASFVLVSFNDEGFIAPSEMRQLLTQIGKLEVIEIPYNTFRGSRNLRGRSIHVTEQMFLVEK